MRLSRVPLLARGTVSPSYRPTGGGDIYVLTLKTGALNRSRSAMVRTAGRVVEDGRWLYFSSTGRDIAGMNGTIARERRTPMPVKRGPIHGRVLRGAIA
jgi:hypothetical protein